jgi:hypothetical protein
MGVANTVNVRNCSWYPSQASGAPPPARVDHAMCVVQSHKGTAVYVFGGFDGKQSLNDLHMLVTLGWSFVDAPEFAPESRIGHTLTTVILTFPLLQYLLLINETNFRLGQTYI